MMMSLIGLRRGWLQTVAGLNTVVAGEPVGLAGARGSTRHPTATALVARLVQPFAAVARLWRRQRDLRWLAEADDRMLRDVGMTRHDVRRRIHPWL